MLLEIMYSHVGITSCSQAYIKHIFVAYNVVLCYNRHLHGLNVRNLD